MLNLDFDGIFKEGFVDGCFESVSVAQEACFRVCGTDGVAATQAVRRTVGAGVDPAAAIRGVVDAQSARYNGFIQNFAEGFQETEHRMYVGCCSQCSPPTPDQLEKGLPYPEIRRMISESHSRKMITAKHPDGEIHPGNVTQAALNRLLTGEQDADQADHSRLRPVASPAECGGSRLPNLDGPPRPKGVARRGWPTREPT
jgi:hypothetical protein